MYRFGLGSATTVILQTQAPFQFFSTVPPNTEVKAVVVASSYESSTDSGAYSSNAYRSAASATVSRPYNTSRVSIRNRGVSVS